MLCALEQGYVYSVLSSPVLHSWTEADWPTHHPGHFLSSLHSGFLSGWVFYQHFHGLGSWVNGHIKSSAGCLTRAWCVPTPDIKACVCPGSIGCHRLCYRIAAGLQNPFQMQQVWKGLGDACGPVRGRSWNAGRSEALHGHPFES